MPTMTPGTHYHLAVIGAGQGGGPLAGAFARAGKRVALIERSHVGGTCINEGCTPTKTVLGIEGGEIAGLLQIAMMGNLHYGVLRDGVFSHPTLAESLNNLLRRWTGVAEVHRLFLESRDVGVERRHLWPEQHVDRGLYREPSSAGTSRSQPASNDAEGVGNDE